MYDEYGNRIPTPRKMRMAERFHRWFGWCSWRWISRERNDVECRICGAIQRDNPTW